MRILVTGGTGFLGRVLVRKLLEERGPRVRLLIRDPARLGDIDPARVELVAGDLADEAALDIATRGVDRVFHLAGINSGTWPEYEEQIVHGTRRLVDASVRAGVARFVYVSSIFTVESLTAAGVIDENTPYRTNHLNSYARSRILAEQIVLGAAAERGLDAVIARPGQIFGPGNDRLLEVGHRLGTRALLVSGRDGPLPAVFVDHAAGALLLIAERGRKGEVYHVVDDPIAKSCYLRCLEKHLPGTRVYHVPDSIIRAAALATGLVSRAHPAAARLHRQAAMAKDRLAGSDVRYCSAKLKELGWKQERATEAALLLTLQDCARRLDDRTNEAAAAEAAGPAGTPAPHPRRST